MKYTKNIDIHICGLYSYIDKDSIPKALHEDLAELCYWTNPNDFNDSAEFYLDGEMYTGVHTKVKTFLEDKGYSVTLLRGEYCKKLQGKFIGKFRPLQKDLVDTVARERYGLVEAPPRSGKTVMMAAAIDKMSRKSMIVVEESAPFEQAIDLLESLTTFKIGVIQGQTCTDGEVIVAMRQTLANALNSNDTEVLSILKSVECLFIDEAHNAQGPSYNKILHALQDNMYSIVGWSGTPYTDNEREEYFFSLMGSVICGITPAQAIDNGLILPLSIHFEHVPPRNFGYMDADDKSKIDMRKAYARVKKEYIIHNKERNKLIATAAIDAMNEGLFVGISVGQLVQAELLKKLIPGSAVLTSGMKNRKEILDKFRNGEYKCVISTLFEEATDIPIMDMIILAAGGKNKKTLMQSALRGTTRREGKDRGYVVIPFDKADFVEYHSRILLSHMREYARQHKDIKIYVNGKELKS